MAVYKRSYSIYTGQVTTPWTRVLVLSRYAFAEAWSSKITVGLFIFCLLPCLVSLFGIYLANNPMARALVGAGGSQMIAIDARFFLKILEGQCWLALVLASWIAPRLISFDLADNALPILLSHPISRVGYLTGKFIALVTCLSAVTWVPCLLLFVYEGYTSPQPWFADNLRIAIGLFSGAVIWIAFLSVLGLALSSWVKWRVVATGIIFAAVFVPAGVGGIVSAVLRTKWGFLLNIPFMISTLWQRLLGAPEFSSFALPTGAIVAMFVLACILCLGMLDKRIRAREVVRG
ncbi:MAG: ABC transporter permease subunit [Terracidiphilus sp.]|jgi:ABC-type transport system involved in multi-copper enzyme maturation permease subunit